MLTNALSAPPLPLQQQVVDDRVLLTVPWAMLLRWVLAEASAPSYVEGPHTDRVDPLQADENGAANFRPGTWWYETDRGVFYQARSVITPPATEPKPTWVYALGTMWGTLSPDERPIDLHFADTGFEFRGTDQARHFIWSGSAWVEVTPVWYETHAARPAPGTIAGGVLYVETDRGNVVYQLQGGVWWYVAGTMYGTMSPDQRPTDLGIHEGGFEFRTTDFPARHFIWSQTAWVEVTPAKQTPWTQHIDGAGFNLNNAGRITATAGVVNKCDAGTGLDSVNPVAGAWYAYAPSNTSFFIRMRGSDGIWRQVQLTLA